MIRLVFVLVVVLLASGSEARKPPAGGSCGLTCFRKVYVHCTEESRQGEAPLEQDLC